MGKTLRILIKREKKRGREIREREERGREGISFYDISIFQHVQTHQTYTVLSQNCSSYFEIVFSIFSLKSLKIRIGEINNLRKSKKKKMFFFFFFLFGFCDVGRWHSTVTGGNGREGRRENPFSSSSSNITKLISILDTSACEWHKLTFVLFLMQPHNDNKFLISLTEYTTKININHN